MSEKGTRESQDAPIDVDAGVHSDLLAGAPRRTTPDGSRGILIAGSKSVPLSSAAQRGNSPASRAISSIVLTLLAVVMVVSPVWAAPVEVRFLEGVTRGFLVLRSTAGQIVAHGELLQTARPDRVDSRMTFRFKDGSLYDEKVVFSQQHVFTLLSYRLVQRGPSFPESMDVSLDRKQGRYQVKSVEKGREKDSSGTIELPPDVYNGMTSMLLKNLARGSSESVHYVAFTPTPRLIKLDLVPVGEQKLRIGEEEGQATRFAIRPKLGVAMGAIAALLGKTPANYECVIWTKDLPAFVRCDGPLRLKGPVYRIEQTNPR